MKKRINKNTIYRGIKTVLPALIVFFIFSNIVLVVIFLDEVKVREGAMVANNIKMLSFTDSQFKKAFNDAETDLDVLLSHRELSGYLNTEGEQSQAHFEELKEEFIGFMRSKPIYDQLRLFDLKGNEIVRVHHEFNDIISVPENQLQNKMDRYYFAESLLLEQGEIYISRFDLNVEHEGVEYPFNPVIRFTTPVYNDRNEKVAILAINYLGDNLLQGSEDFYSFNEGNNFLLIDQEGYWLKSLDKDDEWGFVIEENAGKKFSTSNPIVWDNVSEVGFYNPKKAEYFEKNHEDAWVEMKKKNIRHIEIKDKGHFSILQIMPSANNPEVVYYAIAFMDQETFVMNVGQFIKGGIEVMIIFWLFFTVFTILFFKYGTSSKK